MANLLRRSFRALSFFCFASYFVSQLLHVCCFWLLYLEFSHRQVKSYAMTNLGHFSFKSLSPLILEQSATFTNSVFLTAAQLTELSPKASNASSHERRLRVFMPADSPSIYLCKTIVSSVALGYPVPTLLNWGGSFNRPEWHFRGSHIAKLEGFHAVVAELLENDTDADEDDLALMVDAHDIWFQLPPSVLIQRFHQLNHEADERNRKLWQDASKHAGFPISPPRQSIIVTAGKNCNPPASSGSDAHYELWPDSPMPTDLYGEGTDMHAPPLSDPSRQHRKFRPRCLNSGMIMGTMGALREALGRCQHKVDGVARRGRQVWSDQSLIGKVIGDQEAWRHWGREVAKTWNGTSAQIPSSISNRHVRDIGLAAMGGVQFEFSVGLDYNFTMIPPTCSAEEDGYFVHIGDSSSLQTMSENAGVPDGVRVKGVPPELRESSLDDDPFASMDWASESLYTDFFFGTTPVGIHHNAHVDGLKPFRLKGWWTKMWFYPRLRNLVKQQLQASSSRARELLRLSEGDHCQGAVIYQASKEPQVTAFTPARNNEPSGFRPIS